MNSELQTSKSGKKILVVDDEHYVTKLLKSRLMVHRYEVLIAGDGKEACQLVKTEKPNLVIVDVLMPEMDGKEFVKALRSQETETKDTPVIVISAQPDTRSRFEEGEIQAFMHKPIDADDLLAEISRIMGNTGS